MAYTTIKKPSDYFNTKLYTGDGTDGRGITGVGFQPDWCWFKARSTAYENQVYDVVRGATKRLVTNDTTAEGTQTNGLQSFDSDGFTVGNANGTNVNAVTYASWNWLGANGTASNTDGSITSTVSANTTSGFSIVSYSGGGSFGDTVGHGLGSVPAMIIVKCTSASSDWYIWQKNMGANDNQFMAFNNSALQTSGATIFNVSAMSSTTFTLGTNIDVNGSGRTFVAYCFAEVKGFSKFGSFVGNGNADGPFIYCGFKPAFIMIKKSSGTENWSMYDTKRNINGTTNTLPLNADNTSIESNNTGKNMDILSNGVKIYTSNGELNLSGETYIYMAFAEEPLVGDNPATAR